METQAIIELLQNADKPIFLVMFYVGFQAWKTFKGEIQVFNSAISSLTQTSIEMKNEFQEFRKEVSELKEKFIEHAAISKVETESIKKRIELLENK